MIAILILFLSMNLNPLLNPNYIDFHQATDTEIWVYGSSNSGKSYSIADKLLLQQLWQKDKSILKAVIARRTLPSLKRTALDIVAKRAKALGFSFDLNKQEMEARSGNMKFIFLSLNNKEDFQKLKSMTDVDFIWFNELLELREKDYDEALRRLRGGESDFEQLIADFNPEDKFSWVHKRGWESSLGKDILKLHRNVYANHPNYLKTDKAQREVARLKRYKDVDPNQYLIYFKGGWGALVGVIFNWPVVELPDIRFDEIFYGGDFGFSVDHAALVRIYRKADYFWVEQLIYELGLTNPKLIKRMEDLEIPYHAEQFWDCAEPKSIQELCDAGFNAKPCRKGKDSIRHGIDSLLSKNIHIVDDETHNSPNIIAEAKRYTWKVDKDGNSLNVPIEENDHLMTAIRYPIYTKYGHKRRQSPQATAIDVVSGI